MKNSIIIVSMIVLSVISGLYLPVKADIDNSANGQWQYVIKRSDTKSVAGTLPPPIDCPVYIGYFSLDFKPIKADRKGRYVINVKDGEKQVVSGSSKKYLVGAKSYEMKGSYTPIDTNEYCTKPLTKSAGEKAPLLMRKIEANGTKLEWDSDFFYGSKSQNAIWQVKANYDGSNAMRGTLKAYVCAGNKRTSCKLLNTAKFFAQRVKSIKEASGKPLFSQAISLSPVEKLIQNVKNLINGEKDQEIVSESLYSQDEKLLLSKYIKPSLLATLPSFAGGTIGLEICKSKASANTVVVDNGVTCTACTRINCKPGETPTSREEGICYGNADGTRVCQCDCSNCSGASLSNYTSACQSL
jgi:hypothetical protein